MKLYVVSIFRQIAADSKTESKGETKDAAAIRLATATLLDSISYFTRRATGEHQQFAARLAATKTAAGSRATMTAKGADCTLLRCHCFIPLRCALNVLVVCRRLPRACARGRPRCGVRCRR
jgi:hypothetical protein